MILSFFSVKIIPAAYAAHDCKLYISHLPIPIWNEEIKNKARARRTLARPSGMQSVYFTSTARCASPRCIFV